MKVRSIRALNTTAGKREYVVLVVGEYSKLAVMKDALSCCELRTEVAFIHNEDSKDGELKPSL